MQIGRVFSSPTRVIIGGATVFFMALPPQLAMANCRIAQADAQLCQSGIAAAVAHERVHAQKAAGSTADDSVKLADLLQRSGCKAAGASGLQSHLNVIARGPVTLEGKVTEVVSIEVDRSAYWYIAADALRGRCAVSRR